MTLTPDQIDAAEAAALGILEEIDGWVQEEGDYPPFFGFASVRTHANLTILGRQSHAIIADAIRRGPGAP